MFGRLRRAYYRWRRQGFGHHAAYRLIPLEVEAEAAAERFTAGPGEGGPRPLR